MELDNSIHEVNTTLVSTEKCIDTTDEISSGRPR